MSRDAVSAIRSSALEKRAPFVVPQLRRLIDPCGAFLPSLALHDLADRISGQSARANARWGWVRRPAQGRRLIWLATGATFASVRLGVELLRAIHETRRDVALALTFETEFADLLARLPESPRIGAGFAPADYVGSLNAFWRRLDPMGIILAGVLPRPNLARACACGWHTLAVAPPATGVLPVERVYPTHATAWPGALSAPAADLSVLLTEAQIEPSLASFTSAGATRRLWWWHGDDPEHALRFIAMFRGHLREDAIVVGGPAVGSLPKTAECVLRLSRWDRTPITPGTCIMLDEAKWLPAIAAAATGAHFCTSDHDAFWQALACGLSVTRAPDVGCPSPTANRVADTLEDEIAVVESWRALAQDAATLRARCDDARRVFWQERRLAESNVRELLERVFAWD